MKRKWGDRRDAVLLKKIDSMHFIMPLIMPNRCDNEAFINDCLDLTEVMKYLEKKNAANPEYKYNVFQVLVAAVLKTITLRPHLNRFIKNDNLYQRNEVTAAFTVKKVFSDSGDEALARVHAKKTDTLETVHNEIYRQLTFLRKDDGKDSSTQSMDMLQHIPQFLKKGLGIGVRFLDNHGWMPSSLIETDPFQSSVVLANLGSIKLKAGYHHLTNWGTTSLFCVMGEIKDRPFRNEDGTEELRPSVEIGLTVDERISDGYYCSRSIALLKELMAHPEYLDLPFGQKVSF